jgi:integrase
MVSMNLKYVHQFRDRHGRTRAYFRHKGRNIALQGNIGSEEFLRHYQECLEQLKPSQRATSSERPKGSLGAVAIAYFRSPNFRSLGDLSQKEYRRVIERLCEKHGDKAIARMERRHVIKFRDELADTPGAANTLVRVLRVLLSFAIDQGTLGDNPARGVKQFKIGEFRAWTDSEIEQFRQRWAPGTMQRRAMELALYTGQRRADLVVMTKADLEGNAIRVVQSKTGARVTIPMHETLREQLLQGKQNHLSLLFTTEGKAFDGVYLGAWFKDAIGAAGLPDDCQLHGLRKTAARMLAEVGCSELEIMAITGHKTSRMVIKYTRDADQRTRADAAILKWERNRK